MTAVPTEFEEATEVPEPAAKTNARAMFKYSQYVHIGDGAAECETAQALERGEQPPACTNPEHFHAWCRLPNPFQHQDIREKGLAAKARKLRELRDPESNVSVILDTELERAYEPEFRAVLIDELIAGQWADDFLDAQGRTDEREEFEHIVHDREEYERLRSDQEALPSEEQSDEFKGLLTVIGDYSNAVRVELEKLQQPEQERLASKAPDEIITLVRTKRSEDLSDRAFLDTYNAWMWFVGTLKVEPHPTLGRPYIQMWESIGSRERAEPGTMFGEAPEVIPVLKEVFNELSLALQAATVGNS